MKVLISAAGSPASISIIKHLHFLGHYVIGINSSEYALDLAKAFCDETHLVPKATSPIFFDFITKLINLSDVFIPYIDEELLFFANNWPLFCEDVRNKILICEPKTLLECVDKVKFQCISENLGLPIAQSIKSIPSIFKPRTGRGGSGVFKISNDSLLQHALSMDGVIQQFIEGDEYTVDAVFDKNGSLLGTSSRRRIMSSGVSTVGSVSFDKELHNIAIQLATIWKFKYAINFQVIRDTRGQDFIIEINPRLAGSSYFSTLAGFDPFGLTLDIYSGNEIIINDVKNIQINRYWSEYVVQ